MDYIATRGLGLEQNIVFEKYNYDTGQLEYRNVPTYMAPISVQNSLTKVSITDNVPLTAEENYIYNKLKGKKRNAYLKKIASKKGILDKLKKQAEEEWDTEKDFFIEINNSKNGEIIKRKMRFTESEILHYERLMSQEDKKNFIYEVGKKRGIYESIVKEAKGKWGKDLRPIQERYSLFNILLSLSESIVNVSLWTIAKYRSLKNLIRFRKKL